MILRELNSEVETINHSTSLSAFATGWDKCMQLLGQLIAQEKKVKFTNSPTAELARLKSEEQSHLRDAIHRCAENTENRIRENEEYSLAEWFDKEISVTKNRFDKKNWVLAERLSEKVHGFAKISKAQADLTVIAAMERRFAYTYKDVYDRMLNAEECRAAYRALLNEYEHRDLSLAEQTRFELLRDEYGPKFNDPNPIVYIDSMEGHAFEEYCASILRKIGFSNVSVTPGSGDQGVDVVAVKDEIRYAIQCKCYASDLGNTPVQEVFAGKSMYDCQIGVVMTNRYFTAGAKELAKKNGVLLWDRDRLVQMIEQATKAESFSK